MADIRPFRAYRPPADKAELLTSRSFESYTKEELADILSENPCSFLHIIHPGQPAVRKLSSENRFKAVRDKFQEFKDRKHLIQDRKPGFYVYQLDIKDYSCQGFLALTSTRDYKENIIKRHENTLARRERLFASYLNGVGFNAEPVLMTYPDSRNIGSLLKTATKVDPCLDFSSPDGARHRIWQMTEKDRIEELQTEFEAIDKLYIADGHHRSASSALLSDLRKNPDPASPYNHFMSCLIPESAVRIYEFNRMVRDLNGYSATEFLKLLTSAFQITPKGPLIKRPGKKHHFGMYLQGEYYELRLKVKDKERGPLSLLDTHILYTRILRPLLGVEDLRNDNRIAYGYGKQNLLSMKNAIDQGEFEVGFSLVPVNIEEIKDIADAGLVMPPKSTYIEPKLRSGLTIYELSEASL